jgi:hypothetical protein
MRPSRLRWAEWVLACVMSPRDLEVLIGDLDEERALLSRSMARREVAGWYWSQVVRSIPLLLWASVRRGGFFATVTAAVGACIVQSIVELTTKSVLSSLFTHHASLPALLALLVTIPTLVFVSYLAARIRPGAAIALTVLIVLAIVVQLMMKTGNNMSLWNQVAALLIAPSAAFAGGVLAVRKPHVHAR